MPVAAGQYAALAGPGAGVALADGREARVTAALAAVRGGDAAVRAGVDARAAAVAAAAALAGGGPPDAPAQGNQP